MKETPIFFCACLVALLMPLTVSAVAPTEITVDLKLDASDFIAGERVRGVIDIANSSPDTIGIGGKFRVWGMEGSNRVVKADYNVNDRFFIEVSRASNGSQLSQVSKTPFVANFAVECGEGQKLETFLADHYALREPSRYLAKPVLVHEGVRFEGQPRAFDIVEGVRVGSAMQMFANCKGLQREFELVYWSKARGEHLFLKAKDAGVSSRLWTTRDLGPILRLDKPTISILPSGEIIVLHRLNQDQFVRSEFWSLPNALEFRGCMAVSDPETAGTARVRELYKEKGVAPKTNPWWKFW